MYKLLKPHKFPKLTQEEIESLNRLTANKGIESIIKNLPTAGHQWFMPVILATQETEIRRIEV
jgi:hypothetical protein